MILLRLHSDHQDQVCNAYIYVPLFQNQPIVFFFINLLKNAVPPEVTISLSTHQSDMLNMMKHQFYCDLVIVVGSIRFYVHRFVLAAGSQAFNRLLNIDFSDMGARSSSESSVVSSTYGDNSNVDFNEDTEYLIRCDQSKLPQTR